MNRLHRLGRLFFGNPLKCVAMATLVLGLGLSKETESLAARVVGNTLAGIAAGTITAVVALCIICYGIIGVDRQMEEERKRSQCEE